MDIRVLRYFLVVAREESFSRAADALYLSQPTLSRQIREMEEELGIKALGYVPEIRDFSLESRHLGLVMPEEIEGIQARLDALALKLEESLDLDGLLSLAGEAADFKAPQPPGRKKPSSSRDLRSLKPSA